MKDSISRVRLVDRYTEISAPLRLINAACSEAFEGKSRLENPAYLLECIWETVSNFTAEMDRLLKSDEILEREVSNEVPDIRGGEEASQGVEGQPKLDS